MFGHSVRSAQVVVSIGPLDLDVTYSASYTPSKTSGPPENCYPEDQELDIESITYSGEDVMDLLADSVIEQIEAKCWEDANANWSDDNQADALYDAWREQQELRCE